MRGGALPPPLPPPPLPRTSEEIEAAKARELAKVAARAKKAAAKAAR